MTYRPYFSLVTSNKADNQIFRAFLQKIPWKIFPGDLVGMFGELCLLPYQEDGVAEHEFSTFPEASEDGVIHKINHFTSS